MRLFCLIFFFIFLFFQASLEVCRPTKTVVTALTSSSSSGCRALGEPIFSLFTRRCVAAWHELSQSPGIGLPHWNWFLGVSAREREREREEILILNWKNTQSVINRWMARRAGAFAPRQKEGISRLSLCDNDEWVVRPGVLPRLWRAEDAPLKTRDWSVCNAFIYIYRVLRACWGGQKYTNPRRAKQKYEIIPSQSLLQISSL